MLLRRHKRKNLTKAQDIKPAPKAEKKPEPKKEVEKKTGK